MALFITLSRASGGGAIVPPMANPHIIKPETQGNSRYFFTREHGPEAEALCRKAFLEEDTSMTEAVHAAFGDQNFWQALPVILPSDPAATRTRRRLVQMRREEDAPSALT